MGIEIKGIKSYLTKRLIGDQILFHRIRNQYFTSLFRLCDWKKNIEQI